MCGQFNLCSFVKLIYDYFFFFGQVNFVYLCGQVNFGKINFVYFCSQVNLYFCSQVNFVYFCSQVNLYFCSQVNFVYFCSQVNFVYFCNTVNLQTTFSHLFWSCAHRACFCITVFCFCCFLYL